MDGIIPVEITRSDGGMYGGMNGKIDRYIDR